MTKVVKTDYAVAKLIPYNCRYLGDIWTVSCKYFGDIAKGLYENTSLLEGSACNYKYDTFWDLYIRVVDDKFVTGIYREIDVYQFRSNKPPFSTKQ